MKNKYLVLVLFLALTKSVLAQVQLSVYSEVSIVTAGPGTELYEAFGHSAIRIKDPVLRLDLIYNYGMFDFNAPNFYANFTKGKLKYKLGRYPFEYFLNSYKQQKRWVKQQVLNLSQKEKQAFFIYLEKNALPQNASYFYDPYFNNCATKLRDISEDILADKLQFIASDLEKSLSFRQLMDREIYWNSWGSFGINLALGSKLDATATFEQYMYLPDYVYLIFKNSKVFVENQPENLVKREDVILDFKEKEQKTSIYNPFFIFSIITLIGLFLTFKDYKNNKRTRFLDFILLFTTGLVGVLICFLWFFTDHSTTPNNFNILWAFAPNILISFLMLSKQPKNWVRNYFRISLLLLLVIPFIWFLKVQQFPLAILPFLVLLVARYFFLSFNIGYKTFK